LPAEPIRLPDPCGSAPSSTARGETSGSEAQQAHIRNFLDAVRTRKRESLNQEIASGHVSTTICHAGHIAWRTGKKVRLVLQSESFDDSEANQYLRRDHRKGFELSRDQLSAESRGGEHASV
jgi:hypothetical protein